MMLQDITGWFSQNTVHPQGVGLAWSDNPTNPASWTYHGNIGPGNRPLILLKKTDYGIFFRPPFQILFTGLQPLSNGTYSAPVTVLSPTLPWEAYRVDESYVFKRNDGKWILTYMGDAGSVTEQVGYATADNITGPYTKFAGNPCIPFGPPGSFDAGTVADPWVYEYHGVYYIGYTVSSTKLSPWQTAVATTTDWQTFTKAGSYLFPIAGSGWDAVNSFRGAVTRDRKHLCISIYRWINLKWELQLNLSIWTPSDIINNAEASLIFLMVLTEPALILQSGQLQMAM